jgi:hypothetical protein
MERLANIRYLLNWGPIDGEGPSASEGGAPAWNTRAWRRRNHRGEDKPVVLWEETHTGSAVAGEVKFAKVQFFFKGIIVGSW